MSRITDLAEEFAAEQARSESAAFEKAIKRIKPWEETKMIINGNFYSETELRANFKAMEKELGEIKVENAELKARAAELESKHWDECRQIAHYSDELRKAKELLKAAVEDFAKLDRVNTKVRNCMMPDMDCVDCPLSWDSVDDSVEPCHNWRYTNEAEKLIGEDINVNTREDGE